MREKRTALKKKSRTGLEFGGQLISATVSSPAPAAASAAATAESETTSVLTVVLVAAAAVAAAASPVRPAVILLAVVRAPIF